MRKVLISGGIGNALEWYDYALYGHLAALLSAHFFPSSDPTVSLLAAFGVFAAGYTMRPLGAIFFGYIGDRYGRKKALTVSILLMAFPTASIGLLPTYAQIGIAAPILLTLIRFLQGISLGGEFSGSITFVVEHANPKLRGFAGSTSMLSMCVGILAGSGMAALTTSLLGEQAMHDWGWRIPFLLGLFVGLIGFYIRAKLDESPAYETAKEEGAISETPVRDMCRHHLKTLLVVLGIYLVVTVAFYIQVIYSTAFFEKVLGYSYRTAISLNTLGLVALLALIPFGGLLSDYVGRTRTMLATVIGFLLFIYPLFLLMTGGGTLLPALGMVGFALLVGIYVGPFPALMVESFPTSVRYTGMALSYNIGAALFGGTAPLVCTWLIGMTDNPMVVACYILVCAAISLVCLLIYKRSQKIYL